MPIRTKIECPKCETDLVVKRGGVCPNCGTPISEHVARVRARERRIEQVVAIVASALVLTLFVFTSGIGLDRRNSRLRRGGRYDFLPRPPTFFVPSPLLRLSLVDAGRRGRHF